VYEARYGWHGRTIGLVVVAVVFDVLAVVLPMPLWLRVAILLLFGGGLLVMLAGILGQRLALRVDETGITLGSPPLRPASKAQVVPWADIRRVVLWRQALPYAQTMRYVGLERRHGAPPLAGPRARKAGRIAGSALAPHVDPETLMASRAVNGWRLDPQRLAAAVAHFAPGVQVVSD
jgi:hypothetical protein